MVLRIANANSAFVTSYQKVNPVKSHCILNDEETYKLFLLPRSHGKTIVVCSKVRQSSHVLKRHMKIHKNYI